MLQLKLAPSTEGKHPNLELSGFSGAALKVLTAQPLTEKKWQEIFPIYLSDEKSFFSSQQLPLLGQYKIENKRLRFIPQYPLIAGEHYLAVFYPEYFNKSLNLEFPLKDPKKKSEFLVSLPRPVSSKAQVLNIYPTSPLIPENILRFYIYFSEPMREGEALQQIHLWDEAGQEIPDIFLDPPQELWNSDFTRLTLFLDPARVKSGLIAHKNWGRALKAGNNYHLVINKKWRTAEGSELSTAFEKKFTVIPEDKIKPVIDKLTTPKAKTFDPLVIYFNKPMDKALLHLCLQIRNSQGEMVPGSWKTLADEKNNQFIPAEPWEKLAYTLALDGRLEDVAGNNFFSPFEKPVGQDEVTPKDKLIYFSFKVS
jgi:hypothetical protein